MTTYHRLREKTCIAIAYTVPVYIEVYDGHHKIEDFSTPSQKKTKKKTKQYFRRQAYYISWDSQLHAIIRYGLGSFRYSYPPLYSNSCYMVNRILHNDHSMCADRELSTQISAIETK